MPLHISPDVLIRIFDKVRREASCAWGCMSTRYCAVFNLFFCLCGNGNLSGPHCSRISHALMLSLWLALASISSISQRLLLKLHFSLFCLACLGVVVLHCTVPDVVAAGTCSFKNKTRLKWNRKRKIRRVSKEYEILKKRTAMGRRSRRFRKRILRCKNVLVWGLRALIFNHSCLFLLPEKITTMLSKTSRKTWRGRDREERERRGLTSYN